MEPENAVAAAPSEDLSAAAAEKGTAAAASTSPSAAPSLSSPPPSPRTVLLCRVSAMMRVLALPAPLLVLFYDALWLNNTCDVRMGNACMVVWQVTFPVVC